MSRPEIPIDWEKVDELMIAGCLGTEIAAYFAIHPNTFYRRVEEKYGISFSEYLSEKHSNGESILRAHQYAKALGLTDKGDNTLLIWLGKTRLKQREEKTLSVTTDSKFFEMMMEAEGKSKDLVNDDKKPSQ